MKSIIALLVLFCLYQRHEAADCPSEFEYLPEAKGCFKVIIDYLNWNQAAEACGDLVSGAHLAAITDAAKQDAIAKYLTRAFEKSDTDDCKIYRNEKWWHEGSRNFWISGQTEDPKRCGKSFLWKTALKTKTPFSYSKWIPGKPNCLSNEDRCVYLIAGQDYSWNTMDCRISTCAICET